MPASRDDELVTLSPGAEKDPLAREIRRRVLDSLARGHGRRGFERLWGTVVIVCKEDRPTGSPRVNPPRTTLTLRFDYGRLTIHEGRVGRPDVTLWGTWEEIFSWAPGDAEETPPRASGIAAALGSARALRSVFVSGGLRVFGRVSHPRLVYRLARLLAAAPRVAFDDDGRLD